MEYEGGPIKLYSARHRRLLGFTNFTPFHDMCGEPVREIILQLCPPLRWNDVPGTTANVPVLRFVLTWDRQLGGLLVPTDTPLSLLPNFCPL